MKYCYSTKNNRRYVEATKEEIESLFGDDKSSNYIRDIYHNKISISEVPDMIRDAVQKVLDNREKHWGRYKK